MLFASKTNSSWPRPGTSAHASINAASGRQPFASLKSTVVLTGTNSFSAKSKSAQYSMRSIASRAGAWCFRSVNVCRIISVFVAGVSRIQFFGCGVADKNSSKRPSGSISRSSKSPRKMLPQRSKMLNKSKLLKRRSRLKPSQKMLQKPWMKPISSSKKEPIRKSTRKLLRSTTSYLQRMN